MRRSSLASLPKRVGRPLNPAIAIALGSGNDGTAGVAYTTVTFGTLLAGDGFTLSGNALTCQVPGLYELSLTVSANIPVGTLGQVAYRIGSASEVVLGLLSNAAIQPVSFRTLLKLGAGDALQIRIAGNTGGDSIQTYGVTGPNSNRLTLEQVSTFQ